MAKYEYALSRAAFDFWREQPVEEQQRLADFFDWLARNPHYLGDMQHDTEGLPGGISECGIYVVAHRTDHAVCEVRIRKIIKD